MPNDTTCLCGKLRVKLFEDISENDAVWLQRTLVERNKAVRTGVSPRANKSSSVETSRSLSSSSSSSQYSQAPTTAASPPWSTSTPPVHGSIEQLIETVTSASADVQMQSLQPPHSGVLQGVIDESATPPERASNSVIPAGMNANSPKRQKPNDESRHLSFSRAKALIQTYPDTELEKFLESEKQQKQDPTAFLEHILQYRQLFWPAVSHPDIRVTLYQLYLRVESAGTIQHILQRLLCVAFSSLHTRNKSRADLYALATGPGETLPAEQLAIIKNTVARMVRYGSAWQDAIRLCNDQTGILLLLGKGYLWDVSSSRERQHAIEYMLASSSLGANAQTLAPLANSLLVRLRSLHGFINSNRFLPDLSAPGSGINQYPRRLVGQPYVQHRASSSRHVFPSLPSSILPVSLSADELRHDSLDKSQNYPSENTFVQAPSDQHVLWTKEVQNTFQLDSDDAAHLLVIVMFFDPTSLSAVVLEEGCKPQRRWKEDGDFNTIEPRISGLNSTVVSLITNHVRFQRALDSLISGSLLKQQEQKTFAIAFDVQSLRNTIPPDVQRYWERQALLLVCHAFPRDRLPRQEFNAIAKACLPHLKFLLRHYSYEVQYEHQSPMLWWDLAEVLVAASFYGDSDWKSEAMAISQSIISARNTPFHIHAVVKCRQSILYRLSNELDKSDLILESAAALRPSSDLITGRDKALRSLVEISRIHNMIARDDFDAAVQTLRVLIKQTSTPTSTLQKMASQRLKLSLAQALRYQGFFGEAYELLILLWKNIEESTPGLNLVSFRREVLTDLVEVSCEMNEPGIHETTIISELEDISRLGGQRQTSARRLQLSYAHCRSWQGDYEVAKAIYLDFLSTPMGDLTERNLLEARIGMARIHHLAGDLDRALSCWSAALQSLATYHLGDGRTTQIIHYSSADILRKQGRRELALRSIDEARKVPRGRGGPCWIVGMGTIWRQKMEASLGIPC